MRKGKTGEGETGKGETGKGKLGRETTGTGTRTLGYQFAWRAPTGCLWVLVCLGHVGKEGRVAHGEVKLVARVAQVHHGRQVGA
jgi:hypothetical protein